MERGWRSIRGKRGRRDMCGVCDAWIEVKTRQREDREKKEHRESKKKEREGEVEEEGRK